MTIKEPTRRQLLAITYAGDITVAGVSSGVAGSQTDPGTELAGVGPEGTYARVAVSSTAGSGGVRNFADFSVHAPATGTEYPITHVQLFAGSTRVDWAPLDAPIPIGPQGGVATISGVKFTQT